MEAKNFIKSLLIVVITTVMIAGVVYAGSLTPPAGTVSPQSYTLGDIYNKVSDINYSATPHTVSTTASPSSSFYTLTDIYGKLNTAAGLLTPGNIRSGVTILGVTGNYTGGAPATLTWSDQFNGNLSLPSYSRRLCWDNNAYCTATTGLYNHGGRLLGAKEYCAYLGTDGVNLDNVERNIWRLPTKMELLLAMTMYIANNQQGTAFPASSGFSSLINLGEFRTLWTSEPNPANPINGIITISTTNGTAVEPYNFIKWGVAYTRCVHD